MNTVADLMAEGDRLRFLLIKSMTELERLYYCHFPIYEGKIGLPDEALIKEIKTELGENETDQKRSAKRPQR